MNSVLSFKMFDVLNAFTFTITSVLHVCSDRLKVWDPFKGNYRSICGYENLTIKVSSKLHMTEGGTKAILLSGRTQRWRLLKAPIKEWKDVLWCQSYDWSVCLSTRSGAKNCFLKAQIKVAYYSVFSHFQASGISADPGWYMLYTAQLF